MPGVPPVPAPTEDVDPPSAEPAEIAGADASADALSTGTAPINASVT